MDRLETHAEALREAVAIVLAAGRSTRMRSDLPKVLHPLCGKPMLSYVLDACRNAGLDRIFVVVGHQQDRIREAFADVHDVVWVQQTAQLGTGHAVMMCEPQLGSFQGDAVVIAGDMPLVRPQTLTRLRQVHHARRAVASLATTSLNDPTGYGRIVRDSRGDLQRIIEEADCTDIQRRITEVNISYYSFDCGSLFDALGRIQPANTKGEYYLTDTLHVLISDGGTCAIVDGVAPEDAWGVNSPEDLARVSQAMVRRSQEIQVG